MPKTIRLKMSATVLLLATGCGASDTDGVKREPVAGEVTLDGQPLETGEISFVPTAGGEPVAAAAIKNGVYQVERPYGPSPGPQSVKIWSKKPTGKKYPSDVEPGTFVEETRESIPDRYNLKSELRADVKEGETNRFVFELRSGNSASKAVKR